MNQKPSVLLISFSILLCLAAAGYPSLAQAASIGSQAPYVAGEVLVELKPNISPADKNRVATALGKSHSLHFRQDILQVKITNGLTVEQAVSKMKMDPAVLVAEPNYLSHLEACSIPTSLTDAYFTTAVVPAVPCSSVTGDGNVNWPFTLINAPSAWTTIASSLTCPAANPVTVAVLDTGVASDYITTNHPDLPSSIFVAGYNSTYDYGGDTADTFDNYGHGTWVTGIIAAQWNNSGGTNTCTRGTVPAGSFNGGTAGVAGYPGLVCIMPIKAVQGVTSNGIAAGSTNNVEVIDGIYFAVNNGSKILNLSLGNTTTSALEGEAVTYALNKGCIVVAAAGNNGNASPVDYPAAYPGVIAVGAVGPTDTVSTFSDTGTGLSLVAPGGSGTQPANTFDTAGQIFGCMPNCPAVTVDSSFTLDPCDNNYGEAPGTSAAAPFVSGAAALLLSMNPNFSTAQVTQILETTAHQIIGTQGTYNTTSGWGRLDLGAALSLAVTQTPTPTLSPTPTSTPTATAVLAICAAGQPGNSWTHVGSGNLSSVQEVVFDAHDGNGPRPWLVGYISGGSTYNAEFTGSGVNAFPVSPGPVTNRNNYGVVVFNNSLWLLGGIVGGTTYMNDVWSSWDAVGFLKATGNAGFSPRDDLGALAYNGKLWVIGGLTSSGAVTNDVWSSPDGATWSLATASAAFPARRNFACVVFNGQMWVLGGENTAGTTHYNDIWSSPDGNIWTQVTPTGSVFSARASLLAAVCGNALWILGGTTASGAVSDVWVTPDGANWTQTTTAGSFGTSNEYSASALAYNGQVEIFNSTGLYSSNCCLLPTLTPTAT
ncbi:MAG TPA: S8 family serine peptidase, partial [bacterium]|nr:S8 family serine peptidase [bacterium]